MMLNTDSVSGNMGEKLSVSAPYVGLPLLPSRLHDDDVQQQHCKYKWAQYRVKFKLNLKCNE